MSSLRTYSTSCNFMEKEVVARLAGDWIGIGGFAVAVETLTMIRDFPLHAGDY